MRSTRAAWLLTLACTFLTLPVLAATGTRDVAGGFDLGLGVLDRDFFAAADAYISLKTPELQVGGHVPLKLMLTGADGVRLRRQDWDEASDITRLLRYLDWQPNEAWRIRVGEPAAVTLGHGAIVDHFYNATDLDHYKTSLRVSFQDPRFGIEVFANDMVKWEILAGRLSYRPLGGTTSWVRDLQVALTVATDRAAPTGSALGIDDTNQPIAFRSPLTLYSIDADIPLWRGTQRQVLLYTDLVGMHRSPAFAEVISQNTGGWHFGVRWELPQVTTGADLTLRAEGVYMGQGYLPGWLDNLYEVERFSAQAAHNDEGRTKVAWALQNHAPLGVRGQVDLRMDKVLHLTALLGWLGDDGLSTQLWLALPETSGLTLRAHWGQQHVQSGGDLTVMSRTSALMELRYRIGAALSVLLQGGTRWQAKDEGYAARLEVLGAARLEWRL